MAQHFLTQISAHDGIDLNKQELRNASIQNLATAPTSPATGQIYFDTAASEIKVWDGTAWIGMQDNSYVFSDGSNTFTLSETTNFIFNAGFGISYQLNAPIQGSLTTSINADTTNDFQFGIGTDLQLKDIITAGSVGSSTAIPIITYDATGRITAVNTASITTSLSVAGDFSDGGDMNIDLATETLTIQGTANEIEVVAGYNNTDSLLKIGLPSNVTISNDLTVQGNLIVSGTTTTVNTETINLADNIILLNSNLTTLPTTNAGIEIERGSLNNVELVWNETDDKWQIETDPVNSTYENIATEQYIDSRNYTATITGDASTTSFPITHGANSRNVIVQVYDADTYDTVFVDTVRTNTTTVTCSFGTAPAIGENYVVLITKVA